MNTTSLLVYLFAVICIVTVIYFWLLGTEYCWCAFIKKQAPFVASSHNQRHTIANLINTKYKDANTIIEIGSGQGGFARYISRHTNKNVIGLENMPFCVCVARFFNLFTFGKTKTIFCDAFSWLEKHPNKIDIAIAYLGPKLTKKLLKHRNKIKVLISLNFEIPNIKPTQIINLKSGQVKFGGKKYPHKLFVYEFR